VSSKEGPKTHPSMFIHPRAAQAQEEAEEGPAGCRDCLSLKGLNSLPPNPFHIQIFLPICSVKVVQVLFFIFPISFNLK